jgi:predicted ribosomally synthesized peptide with nif11-like leader
MAAKILNLMKEIQFNEELINKLEKTDKPKEIVRILSEHGYEITVEELGNFTFKNISECELNHDQLDAVSGGFIRRGVRNHPSTW